MTPYQIIALAVRGFAVWLMFNGDRIGLYTYALRSAGQHGEAPYAMAALYLGVAGLLWRFPLAVARHLLPPVGDAPAGAFSARQAIAVALVATGLLVIALHGLGPVASYLSLLAMLAASGQAARLHSLGVHIDGLVGLAMLLAGAILVLRCGGIARVLARRL